MSQEDATKTEDQVWATLRACYRTAWEEDDCAPDAERLREAWQRLFREELDLGRALATHDLGDATARVMPGGRVAVSSYRGNCRIMVLRAEEGAGG